MKSDSHTSGFDSTSKPELQGRKILLGVCGGIAAYKAVELTRLFVKNGARVQVIMTAAATKFVTPLTFETITGHSVYTDMFPEHGKNSPWHTELSSWADVIVVAPATANHMAKLAHGLADDLLSVTLLASERPRVLVPAMNYRMWSNPATQENLVALRRYGYRMIAPEAGEMARPGEGEGIGRLAEPERIYKEIVHVVSAPRDLQGKKVLVTAGRTEESWDPVRVLTNRASGRMGFALAEEARERGADVTLIHGPTDVLPPSGVRTIKIRTASDMAKAVQQEFPRCDVLLMSAAVSDYTFENTAENKIKKGQKDSTVHLIPTVDILKSISGAKGNRTIVGFALETENVLENALKKLREKSLDIVVANNPLERGAGFQHETNQVMIIHRSGRMVDVPLQSKREVAREILNEVIQILKHPESPVEADFELDLESDEEPMFASEEFETAEPANADGTPSRKGRSRRGGKRARRARERRGDSLPISQKVTPPPVQAVVKSPTPVARPVPASVAKQAPAPAATASATAKPFVKKRPRRKPNKKKPEPAETA